jgi:hypothetical protein
MRLLRADIDDPTESTFRHPWSEPLSEQKRRYKVHSERGVPDILAQLRQWRSQIDSRAIDQNVRLPKSLNSRVGNRQDTLACGQIPARVHSLSSLRSELKHRRVQATFVTARQNYTGPCPGERLRYRSPNSGAATGYQGSPTVESKQVSKIGVRGHLREPIRDPL